MTDLFNVMLLVLAYVVGAIPTGLIVGLRLAGVDIREHGSGNIGFTNALRVLGRGLGIPVLLIDVAKAYAVTALVPLAVGELGWGALPLLCGLAALVGNMANVFLGFKGGKGVATALGVYLALAPLEVLLAAAVFLAVLGASRYVSLGSILSAVFLVAAVGWRHGFGGLFSMTAVIAITVIYKHRGNIQRLVAGTENKVGKRHESSEDPPGA